MIFEFLQSHYARKKQWFFRRFRSRDNIHPVHESFDGPIVFLPAGLQTFSCEHLSFSGFRGHMLTCTYWRHKMGFEA